MEATLSVVFHLIRQAGRDWIDDGAPQLSAALAYYALFALSPILLIATTIAGVFWGEETARANIVREVSGYVGPFATTMLDNMVSNAPRKPTTAASIVGIAALLFGASGVFVQLQAALNTVWKVPAAGRRGLGRMIRDRGVAFGMVLGIGGLLLISVGVSTALTTLTSYAPEILPGRSLLLYLVDLIGVGLVATLLFAAIFRFVPDTEVAWVDVWMGAGITAALFSLGKTAIGIYLGRSSVASSYGLVGSVLALLLWTYYSALIVLFGAELTHVYATRCGTRQSLTREPAKAFSASG